MIEDSTYHIERKNKTTITKVETLGIHIGRHNVCTGSLDLKMLLGFEFAKNNKTKKSKPHHAILVFLSNATTHHTPTMNVLHKQCKTPSHERL